MRMPSSVAAAVLACFLTGLTPQESEDVILAQMSDLSAKLMARMGEDPDADIGSLVQEFVRLAERLERAATTPEMRDFGRQMRAMLEEAGVDLKQAAQPRKSPEPRKQAPKHPGVLMHGRFSVNQDTRSLTPEEEREPYGGLRWQPPSVPLPLSGSADSQLLDKEGRVLATVRVRWEKLEQPVAAKGVSYNPSIAHFRVLQANNTTCVYGNDAEIALPGDSLGTVVPKTTWFGWLNLHQPGAGKSERWPARSSTGARSRRSSCGCRSRDPATRCRSAGRGRARRAGRTSSLRQQGIGPPAATIAAISLPWIGTPCR